MPELSKLVEPTGMAEITAGSAEADWLASEFCIWLLRDWLEGVVDIRRKVRVPPLVDRPDLDLEKGKERGNQLAVKAIQYV